MGLSAKQKTRVCIRFIFAGVLLGIIAFPTSVAATTPTPTPATTTARFAATGGARSETFQLAAGRYELLLTIDRNDRRFSVDSWKLELFRLPGDVLLLEGSGYDVSTRARGELSVEDASWNLWFRLDVGDNANWTVALRRVGDLPAPASKPPQSPGPTPAQSAEFSSRGGARSQVFQLDEGRYEVLVAIAGNDRRFVADTWQIVVFRIPGDALLLEGSGRGVSDGWYGELLIEDDSWNLWFRLDVGDDAGWNVRIRRIGELPTPSPQPARSPQPTAPRQPTPTPTPTPQTFQSCQEVPESLIVVDTQGRRATPRDLVPSAPDGDNDGFACGGQLGLAPTPTPERRRTLPPTPIPQTYQSCHDGPKSLVVVDSQGRRAVPRHLVPSAPDGDNDGFACGGQLGLAPTPTPRPTSPPRPTPTKGPTPLSVPSVTAAELVGAWEKNRIRAEDTYEGKTLDISGVVYSIDNIFGQLSIVLYDGSVFSTSFVHCSIDSKYRNWIATIETGRHIILRGRVSGEFLGIIRVDDCAPVRG